MKLVWAEGKEKQHAFAKGLCKQGEKEVKHSPIFSVRCENNKRLWPSELKTGRKEMLREDITTINGFMKHPCAFGTY